MASPVKTQMTKILGGHFAVGMSGGAKIVGGPLCRAAKPRIEAGGRRRLLQDARRSPVQDNQLRQPTPTTKNLNHKRRQIHRLSPCRLAVQLD